MPFKLIGYFLFGLFAVATCEQNETHKQTAHAVHRIEPQVGQIPEEKLIIQLVDSLRETAKKHETYTPLAKLDSIACRSDGELAEAIDEACQTIWEARFKYLVHYLYQHPRTCLRYHLIVGLSFQLDQEVSKKNEDDLGVLRRYRSSMVNQARAEAFSVQEIQYVKALLDQVNPELVR